MVARTEPELDVTRPLLARSAQRVMIYLRQARAARGWSQRALAAKLSVTQPTLAGWENAGSVPRFGKHARSHLPKLDDLLEALDALGLEMVIRPKRGDR